MAVEIWISFVVASTALLAIPGPTVMLVVSYALGRGKETGFATVPGVTLGDFTAMTASLLGAGAIFAASATLFTLMKYAGAAYLIWLGIKLWRSTPQLSEMMTKGEAGGFQSMFWNSYIVTALNPKAILFFVAFVPQFINPENPTFPQFVILEVTFLTLAAANVIAWALLAGRLRRKFKNPKTLKKANRIGASFLVGAGLLTAAIRRSD